MGQIKGIIEKEKKGAADDRGWCVSIFVLICEKGTAAQPFRASDCPLSIQFCATNMGAN